MQIRRCTITGVDERTDLTRLQALATRYPFVEFAVLIGNRQNPSPRYPSWYWARAFTMHHSGQKAAHLCGERVPEFLGGVGQGDMLDGLLATVGRIQLNFNLTRRPELAAMFPLSGEIRSQVQARNQRLIVQVNEANSRLANALHRDDPIDVLFDASGGAGRTPDEWPSPIPEFNCGYAGGLGPENLSDALSRLREVATGAAISLDLESRVRTADDWLDLDKCADVLRQVEPFVLAPSVVCGPRSRPWPVFVGP